MAKVFMGYVLQRNKDKKAVGLDGSKTGYYARETNGILRSTKHAHRATLFTYTGLRRWINFWQTQWPSTLKAYTIKKVYANF